VRHCVLLKFSDGTSTETKDNVLKQLRTLPESIPEILVYNCGLDLGLDPGRNHDIVITADFANQEDYLKYASHEKHIAVITDYIKPILAPGGRAACQFNILDGGIFNQKRNRQGSTLRLNTSNKNKLKEFQRLFKSHGADLDVTQIDLREIDAGPEEVVAHKATSAGEGVLIEDTSLDVEGADVGVNVRWLMDNMSTFANRKATWRVLLGTLQNGKVSIYEGITTGTIVPARGDSAFGFDPVFLPDGSDQTLAEAKPDSVSARSKAVDALIAQTVHRTMEPISSWDGPWQHDD
jgi:XTP/dITP diphosphohydrolase